MKRTPLLHRLSAAVALFLAASIGAQAGDADFASALADVRAQARTAAAAASAQIQSPESLVSACDVERFRLLMRSGTLGPGYNVMRYVDGDYGGPGYWTPSYAIFEYAVARGCHGIVQALLEDPALDPNGHVRRHPLTHAALAGDAALVRLLLADKRTLPQAADKDVPSALMEAAGRGSAEIVELLLARGADPKRMDTGYDRAEDFAAKRGHPAVADLLRKARGHVPGPRDRHRFRLLAPDVANVADAQLGLTGGKNLGAAEGGHIAGASEKGNRYGGSLVVEFLGFVTAPLPVSPGNERPGRVTKEDFIGCLLTAGVRQRLFRFGFGNGDGKGVFIQPYVGAGATPLLFKTVDRNDREDGRERRVKTEHVVGTHVEAGIEASFGTPLRIAVDWRRYFVDPVSADMLGGRVTWAP